MSKVAVISDIHIGVRNDALLFLHNQMEFFENVFFPKLVDEKITTVMILGDVFDRRKYINFHTLYQSHSFLFEQFQEHGISVILLTGNHDCFFKNSNDVNSLDLLLSKYDNFQIYTEPDIINVEGVDITIIPWMNSENENYCYEVIESQSTEIMMGHFEINGFMMHENTVACKNGMDASVFDGYDMILSGHFHQRSTNKQKNITYLGAPSQYTWNDAGCERGFHILDLEKKELTFVVNPYILFYKIFYDDAVDLLTYDFDKLNEKIIQIIVGDKQDRHHFDLFVQKVQEQNPYSLDIIDNTELSFLEEDIDEEAIRSEDTLSIVESYIDSMTSDLDKGILKNMFIQLHQEATNLETAIR